MKVLRIAAVLLLLAALLGACSNTPWRRGSSVTLASLSAPLRESESSPPVQGGAAAPAARPLVVTIPSDWVWLRRGSDLVATRDGIYLQNLTIERFHLTQRKQSTFMFPRLSFTALSWPLRTLSYLQGPLNEGGGREELIDAVIASRKAAPGVSELTVRERSAVTLAGVPAGRVVYDFRLEVGGRHTPYRGVSVVALDGEWCEVVTGVAAAEYYFPRDGSILEGMIATLHTVQGDRVGGAP